MANNLMIPAYQDEDITKRLEQQMKNYHITVSLDTGSFDAPQKTASLQENKARSAVISEIGQCVLGLQSEDTCIANILKIQTEFLEEYCVE